MPDRLDIMHDLLSNDLDKACLLNVPSFCQAQFALVVCKDEANALPLTPFEASKIRARDLPLVIEFSRFTATFTEHTLFVDYRDGDSKEVRYRLW